MKRYGKLIVLAAVVLITIGFYYIQPVFKPDTKPEFALTVKKGDKSLIEDMALEGYYSENYTLGIGSEVKITTEGITYYDDAAYLNSLQGSGLAYEKITQLQNDHKSYMRGKTPDVMNFFEDDSILAYAELDTSNFSSTTEEAQFQIDVLNKKTNDELSFSVDLPQAADYDYMYVEDVEVANNKLIIVTSGTPTNGEALQEEKHFYTISLPNEKIEKDESLQLDLLDSQNKEIQYIELVNATHNVYSSDYLVYRVELSDVPSDMELNEEEQELALSTYSLIGVNVETGEQFLIDISDEVGNQTVGNLISMEDNTLYFHEKNTEGVNVYAYSLAEKELGKVSITDLTETQIAALKDDVTMTVQNGIAIFINSYKKAGENQQIIAFDLESGKSVLEGSIEETTNQTTSKTELFLYDVIYQQE